MLQTHCLEWHPRRAVHRQTIAIPLHSCHQDVRSGTQGGRSDCGRRASDARERHAVPSSDVADCQLQEPWLDRISNNLQQSLHAFLPDVSSVTVLAFSESRRYQAFRRSVELLIDDGVPTELAAKGDGVQSLAAISLLTLASTAKGGALSSQLKSRNRIFTPEPCTV